MVTGAIKNKVDKIWTDIWAGGITNPLTVIEQLTYLMFIRSLDEKELATEDFENMAGEKMEHIFPASAAGQSMRWSRFKDKDSREIFLTMQQRVFPAIKKMKYGRLPDFDASGELVEIEDDPARPDEATSAPVQPETYRQDDYQDAYLGEGAGYARPETHGDIRGQYGPYGQDAYGSTYKQGY